MSYGTNDEVKNEINKLKRNKIIFIAVGAVIAACCLIGIIAINVYSSKLFDDATTAYLYGEISLDEYDKALNYSIMLSLVQVVFSLGLTGGLALAIVGGIVSHVKAKNREKIIRKRDLADNYGGNGVEF